MRRRLKKRQKSSQDSKKDDQEDNDEEEEDVKPEKLDSKKEKDEKKKNVENEGKNVNMVLSTKVEKGKDGKDNKHNVLKSAENIQHKASQQNNQPTKTPKKKDNKTAVSEPIPTRMQGKFTTTQLNTNQNTFSLISNVLRNIDDVLGHQVIVSEVYFFS